MSNMNVIQFKDRDLAFSIIMHDWALGIGVIIEFRESDVLKGAMKLLCEESEPLFDKITEYDEVSLKDHVRTALMDGVYLKEIENMILWQSDILKLGYTNISPVYGKLANAF